MSAVRSLVRAAHPGPSLVVTVVAVALTRVFGGDAALTALVGGAVVAGQLSIGWSNDAIDADRDRTAGRVDKPAAAGDLDPRVLAYAAGAALVAAVVFSWLLGPVAALVHLGLGVAMGWAYNLGLKSTVLSPLPYAVAFATLPSVAALAARGAWAPLWVGAAGAALGVAAHIANCLPDLADDELTGVSGLPHRLGEWGSRVVTAAVLVLGVAAIMTGSGVGSGVLALAGAATVLAAGTAIRGRGRWPFVAIMVLALLVVLLAGGRISRSG